MDSNPMIMEELLLDLRARGVSCDLEVPFDYFLDLTLQTGRVRCALRKRDTDKLYAGFWFHTGSDLGFLGLWNGLLYCVRKPDQICNLASDITRDPLLGDGGTPSRLPGSILGKYGLEECEIVRAWPVSTVERLDEIKSQQLAPEFSLRMFLEKIAPHVDKCKATAGGLVEFKLADMEALTRFCARKDEKQVAFSVVIQGLCLRTSAEYRCLRILSTLLPCTFYDDIWNNRIDWNDPYYAYGDQKKRPHRPRNAFPVE
jgi:hypothetical protein